MIFNIIMVVIVVLFFMCMGNIVIENKKIHFVLKVMLSIYKENTKKILTKVLDEFSFKELQEFEKIYNEEKSNFKKYKSFGEYIEKMSKEMKN